MAEQETRTERTMQLLDLGTCMFVVGVLSLPLAALVSWSAVAFSIAIGGSGVLLMLRGYR